MPALTLRANFLHLLCRSINNPVMNPLHFMVNLHFLINPPEAMLLKLLNSPCLMHHIRFLINLPIMHLHLSINHPLMNSLCFMINPRFLINPPAAMLIHLLDNTLLMHYLRFLINLPPMHILFLTNHPLMNSLYLVINPPHTHL